MVRVKPLRGGGIAYRFAAVTAALASIGLLVPLMFAGPSVPAYAEESTADGTTAATTVETETPKGSGDSEQVKAGSEFADSATSSPSTPAQSDAASQVQGSATGSEPSSGEQADNAPAADVDAVDDKGSITVQWTSAKDGTTQQLDDKGVNQITPTQYDAMSQLANDKTTVSAAYAVTVPTVQEGYPADSVKIRIPKYLFDYQHDGKQIGTTSIPIPDCPTPQQSTGLCKQDDPDDSKSWIVTNPQTLDTSKSNGKYTINVDYSYTGRTDYWSIPNGKTASLTPTLEIVRDGQTSKVDGNTASAKWNTSVTLQSGEKTYKDNTGTWNPAWGTQPDDVKDGEWFYTIWLLSSTYKTNGHPFDFTFTDTPRDDGKIVAASGTYQQALGTDCNSSSSMSSLKVGDNSLNVSAANPQNVNLYECVVVAYPVPTENEKTFHNNMTAILTPTGEEQQTKRDSKEFPYRRPVWQAPAGDMYSLWKGGNPSGSGDFDRLKNGKDTGIQSYAVNSYASPYRNDQNYADHSYTANLVDDLVSLEDTLLGDGDYEFTGYQFGNMTLTDVVPDYATGGWFEKENKDYPDYPERVLYGRKTVDGPWEKIATCIYSNSSLTGDKCKASVDAPGVTASGWGDLTFSGYVGLREQVTTNAYSVRQQGNVSLRIKGSSKTAQKIAKDAEQRGATYLTATNYDTLDVRDGTSHQLGFHASPITDPTTVQQQIQHRDEKRYGLTGDETMYHNSASTRLTGYQKSSSLDKKVERTWSDTTKGRYGVSYSLSLEESIDVTDSGELDQLVNDGIFTPQQDGVFYDLLPKGMTIDTSSVTVRIANFYYKGTAKVTLHDDWHHTGRTLAKIEVTVPNGKNYLYSGGQGISGFTIYFTAWYDWSAAKLYGNQPLNVVSYETGNKEIAKGLGSGDESNESKIDLDYHALLPSILDSSAGDAKRFLYAKASATFSDPTASFTGLTKTVRAADGGAWTSGTSADNQVMVKPESGVYEYRLAFSPDPSVGSVKDMTLYDSLEYCQKIQVSDVANPKCTNTWTGTLQSVDVSQPADLGMTPTVYISHVKNLDLSGKDPNKPNPNRNLNAKTTDGQPVWTKVDDPTTADALEDATAVAVNFGDAELKGEQGIAVILTMKAPKQYSAGYAFNQSWLTSVLTDSSGSNADPLGSNYTQVGLERPVFPVAALPLTGGVGSARWWMLAGGGFGLLAALAGCSYHVWRRRHMV